MTAGNSRSIAFGGALLILAVGIIHAVEAPDYLDEQAYVGVLFILNAVGCFVVAAALATRPDWRAAWALGALIAAVSFIAFILSRTTGLPSFKEDDWEALGVLSMVIEAAFVLVASGVLLGAGSRTPGRPGGSPMGAAQRPQGY